MIIIDEKSFLTPKEAAALLDISMPTIWRWIKAGKLKRYSLSVRQVYLLESDVKGLLR